MFRLLFAANSARNPDGQIGAEMKYFHGLEKQLPAHARGGFGGWKGGAAASATMNPRGVKEDHSLQPPSGE